jgi:hypothetical protein
MNKAVTLSVLLIASAALAENPTVTPKMPAISDGCFQVGTVDELYGFAAAINGTDGFEQNSETDCLEITSDITVNKNVLNADGDLAQDTSTYILWNPPSYFVGTIKGNGHTISGLVIIDDAKKYQNVGFIRSGGGTMENLRFKDIYVEDGDASVYHYVGGIYGKNAASGNTNYGINLKKVSFAGTVLTASYMPVGGIVGKHSARLALEDVHVSGKVKSPSKAGGFSGEADDVIATRSTNEATIVSEGDYAGGFVAYANGNFRVEMTFTESCNKGIVNGYKAAAGFIGYMGYAKASIFNSYNSGDIKARDYIGGLVGAHKAGESPELTIYNSYSVGTISKRSFTYYYGLLGQSHSDNALDLKNSFFIKDTLYNDTAIFYGEAIAASKFEDGTLLSKLQQFEQDSIKGSVWDQDLTSDKFPVLEKRTKQTNSGTDDTENKEEKNEKEAIISTAFSSTTALVTTEGRHVRISGLQSGHKFAIFDLKGNILRQGIATESSVSLEVPHNGIFLVRINGMSKIIKVR